MPIYSIVSLKGGVAKTTTAVHLATCAAASGSKVTVIDCDDECSAVRWFDRAVSMPFDVVAGSKNGLAQQAKALSNQSVFIDTPPNDREVLNKAAMIADVCIVPVEATGLDIDRLRPTLELLRDIEATRENLNVKILFTRWSVNRNLSKEAIEALEGYPVLNTKIRELARYADSFGKIPNYLEEYETVWQELKKCH